MSCPTFTLTGDSYAVILNKPIWGGVNGSVNNQLDVFNFWDDDFDVVNRGLETEPLLLSGIEIMEGDNVGICFPICFPMCFAKPLCDKLEHINEMMDKHEAITITGLGDNVDGVYIISSFDYGTVRESPLSIQWKLDLQYVRES